MSAQLYRNRCAALRRLLTCGRTFVPALVIAASPALAQQWNPHSSFLAPLKEGKLRVLAIAAPQRLPGDFAGVPTWKELGVDAEIEAFRAIAGPKGLGAPQIAYWESKFRALAETAEWKEMLAKRAWVNHFAGPDGCRTGLKRQYDQMRRGLMELGLAKN